MSPIYAYHRYHHSYHCSVIPKKRGARNIMSHRYIITTISLLCSTAILTRSLPFLFARFLENASGIKRIGQKLPPILMLLLMFHCLVKTPFLEYPHGLPEIFSLAIVAILHHWKKNVCLSTLLGTAIYLLIKYLIFFP